MALIFYYDVVCPYAYLASTQVEAIAARAGTTVDWRPVLLGGIYRAVEADQDPTAAMAVPKALHNALDLLRQADRLGVPLEVNARHPQRSVEAMRLVHAAPTERRAALSHALFAHYHRHQGDLSRDGLAPIAAAHGVDMARLDDADVKQALFDTTDEAVAAGAFGVPTFVVDGQFFYGTDHLSFVAEALGTTHAPVTSPPDGVRRRLTVFHDLASPWSFLGAVQVEALAAEMGAELVWAPMLLGIVFREIGTPMIPIQAMSEPKRAWQGRALSLWAERLGVPFRFISTFPVRTVTPNRVALVDPATTLPMYRAAWEQDRDIGDPDVLAAVLDEAGFDGRALLEASKGPGPKEALRANTERAIAIGVPGAPTFLVGDDLLFWGQDRLDMVRAALGGWRPPAG